MSPDCDQRAHRFCRTPDGTGAGRRPRPCDPLCRSRAAGVVAELLFEERLVLVRTTPTDGPLRPEDHVHVDWGEDFAASYHAAFPDAGASVVSISYGPLALDYVLARGGSGYFRMAAVRPFLEEGAWRSSLTAPNSPTRDIWSTRRGRTKPSSIRSERGCVPSPKDWRSRAGPCPFHSTFIMRPLLYAHDPDQPLIAVEIRPADACAVRETVKRCSHGRQDGNAAFGDVRICGQNQLYLREPGASFRR